MLLHKKYRIASWWNSCMDCFLLLAFAERLCVCDWGLSCAWWSCHYEGGLIFTPQAWCLITGSRGALLCAAAKESTPSFFQSNHNKLFFLHCCLKGYPYSSYTGVILLVYQLICCWHHHDGSVPCMMGPIVLHTLTAVRVVGNLHIFTTEI